MDTFGYTKINRHYKQIYDILFNDTLPPPALITSQGG
jgi:hypothetical protein